jgi:hypothetical protein
MIGALLITVSAAAAAPPQEQRPIFNCPEAARADAAAYRLADLPQEIREDLMKWTGNEITDENIPLLRTDSFTDGGKGYAKVRFAQALRFRDRWFVQSEMALVAGVRTITYYRTPNGRFERFPTQYFGGPACATIRAALDGVVTPGGF